MELSRRVGVLKLNGGVVDIEFVSQHLPDALGDSLALRGWHVEDPHVAGKGVGLRAQTPDVNVVDLTHTRDPENDIRHPDETHPLGRTLEQDIG